MTDYITVVANQNGMVRLTVIWLQVSLPHGPLIVHCMGVHGQVPAPKLEYPTFTPKLDYKSQWEEPTQFYFWASIEINKLEVVPNCEQHHGDGNNAWWRDRSLINVTDLNI
jgi:hypothetical protein